MNDPDGEYSKLKRSFNDIADTFNLDVMDGKTMPQILALGSQFKRDILIEAVIKLKELCEKTFGMYERKINSPQSNVVSDIVEKVKNAMTEMVPSLVTSALKARSGNNTSNNVLSDDDEKHVIVIEDKQDKEKKCINESWSQVVKSSVSNKLENIPVQKSLVTKSGQGCLFFPTQGDQEQARSVLQSDFNVSLSTQKKRMLLPKLKVLRIDPSYKK